MSSTGYTLRPAVEQDHDFLYQLHVATMQTYISAMWGWHEEWQREYFDRKWNPSAFQVIQVAGQDAGVLVMHWQENEGVLELIELLPEFQHHGVGTAVIQDLQQQAQARHLPITLHVLKSDEPARRLYERLGFRISEERSDRFVMVWRSQEQESL